MVIFFGPLAWGRVEGEAAPRSVRSGALERVRDVHFEAWPILAPAESLGGGPRVPLGPWTSSNARPDECWLTDAAGAHYASELRLVAVDQSALPGVAR